MQKLVTSPGVVQICDDDNRSGKDDIGEKEDDVVVPKRQPPG